MNIYNYNKNNNIYNINNYIKNFKDASYNTNNNIFYINTLSYNKNNNIYNTNNNIFDMNTLNYKRKNNIYNTHEVAIMLLILFKTLVLLFYIFKIFISMFLSSYQSSCIVLKINFDRKNPKKIS
jgi:hypothetical protein